MGEHSNQPSPNNASQSVENSHSSSMPPSETNNSYSKNSQLKSSQHSPDANRRKSNVTPSKMKVLFHKVKKALRVEKTTALPVDVQNNYYHIKSYRDELAQLIEAIKSVVLPNPQEMKKVGSDLKKCDSTAANDIYEMLYVALTSNKHLFVKYENYDSMMRVAWNLAQEERNHQKTTEKIFKEVNDFIDEEFPKLEHEMKALLNARNDMDFKLTQKASNPMESQLIAEEMNEAKKLFNDLCIKVNVISKELMKLMQNHAQSLPTWVDMRRVHHMKMEKILKKAGFN